MVFIFVEKMQQEREKLVRKKRELEEQIKQYPQGFFICAKNGKYFKWYNSDGHKKVVIPKSNEKLAEELAAKRYLTCISDDISQEIKAIDSYLEISNLNNSNEQQFLSQNQEIQRLIEAHFKPVIEDLFVWANEPYNKNPKNPEHLLHKTIGGYYVRSKSEEIIDRFLTMYKIPFRYECEFYLGNKRVYPDFIIRHPKKGEWYIWEHFGIMDDAAYARQAANKIQLYISHGYIPTIQLITTFETKDNPLTIDKVERIIQEYFLND